MQSVALSLETVVAVLAIGVAVGAPLIGMRLHRRHSPTADATTPALATHDRDDLSVAA